MKSDRANNHSEMLWKRENTTKILFTATKNTFKKDCYSFEQKQKRLTPPLPIIKLNKPGLTAESKYKL